MTSTTKALILGAAFVLSAAVAQAAITVADVLPAYQDGSYSAVEVREGATRITVEATKGGVRTKTVYDKASGAILTTQDYSTMNGGGAGGVGAGGGDDDSDNGSDHSGSGESDHGSDHSGGDRDGGSDHGGDDHGGDRGGDDHGGESDHD